MKLFMLSACLLLTISMVGQSSSPTRTTLVHSSNTSANLLTFSNATDITLGVLRSNNPSGTFLVFDLFSFSDNVVTDTFGSGQIPNQDLTGDNTKHLSLSVDTSQLSSFQTTTCTLSTVTNTQTCQPATGGLIQLEFQQDGAFLVHNISDTLSTFFQFTERDQRNALAASAFANGSVLGLLVSNGHSEIDINRDTTIILTLNH
jgi:hypothetical protein